MPVKGKQLNVLKWLICFTLLISLWSATMLQKASAAVSGDFTYSISSGKATITSYNGSDQNVIIPATIDGFTVNKIGIQAFKARNLTSVSIPNTVTDIENSAFENNQLTMLTIPDSVTFIGSYAFSNNDLSVLTLSENVSSIGVSAFENNELQVLSIPESLSVINMYTFKNNKLTSLSLPEGLLFIFDNAFERNLLTNINLPSSLTNIGNSAFYDNKLTDLSIPNNVNTIGSNAFQANMLTSVHLSSSVTRIENSTFQNNQLTELTIPSGVNYVGQNAFESNQLTSISLPSSLTIIDHAAFAKNKITAVSFPNSLISIGNDAFQQNQLGNITIPSSVSSIGNRAFSTNQLSDITLSDGVGSIGSFAFEENQLTNVYIPSSVTHIHSLAFYHNPLAKAIVAGDSTLVNSSAFGELLDTSIIAFDPSPAKIYAGVSSQPFLNLLAEGVVFTPNGSMFGSTSDTVVTIGSPIPLGLPITVDYRWSSSEVQPTWTGEESSWTTFVSGAPIPVPGSDGPWYLHVRVDDGTHNAGFARSAMFQEKITHTVAFNSQGGSAVDSMTGIVEGSTITEPDAPTRSGYTFAGWYTDGSYATAWNFTTDPVNQDFTLFAKWTAIPTFTVSFHSQGGSAVDSVTGIVDGLTITEPNAPTRSGYTFAGWYTDGSYATAWNFTTDPVNQDLTLFAKWTAIPTFTVSFHSQGGSAVDSMTGIVEGSTITEPNAPTRSGYTFAGWYTDGSYATAWNFTTDPVNQDLTLFAKWTAIPTFTVSFHSQGGSAVDSMTGIVDGLTITEPNAPTRSGYTFAGWYTDGSYATAWNFNMDSVNQNLTLFAKWTAIAISSPAAPSTSELQITYTVSFDSRGGSVISGISAVKAQSTINEPKEPERAGYSFEGWYTEAAYVTLWDFHSNKVTKNLTLYAKWAEISEETNFSDIVGHWANESILKAVKAGIVSGYPNGTFDPSRIVTRTEFLVMLMNALKPASEGADLTFTDAENIPAWGQQAVAQAVQTGIISGYADGTFLPNGPITRAEMALIIARALKIETEENATTSFADDNSIPVWAKGAVAALEKHGIMKGTGANQFNASSMANRAEAVTIILKLLEE